jgi:hypothetical protein
MNTEHFYLTNGCCENVGYIGAHAMERLGLPCGEFEGFFYPLTEAEARFIGSDHIAIGDSGMEAWLGFSILYRDCKWLAPLIEVRYRQEHAADAGLRTRARAAQLSRQILDQVAERAAEVGGHVLMSESDGRFWIELMLPFDLAVRHRDFDGWKHFLEQAFFAGIGTDERDARRTVQALPIRSAAAAAA